MKDQGYGAEYAYDHDAPDGFSGQDYFPEGFGRLRFYEPVERGFERDLIKRIAYFDKLRANGFKVKEEKYCSNIPEKLIDQYRLMKNEILPVVFKN